MITTVDVSVIVFLTKVCIVPIVPIVELKVLVIGVLTSEPKE